MKWLKVISWLLVLVAIFIVNTNSISDADFWWHLETGEYLWESKTIPHQDIFSYTGEGRDWTVHEWLSQVIFYGVYKINGFNGLVYLTALVSTLTLAVVGLIMTKRGVPALVTQLAIFIGAAVNAPFAIPRPQLFYFLLWAVFLFLLDLYDRGQKKAAFGIPILLLVWMNLHASVHLPIILIGLYLGAKLISLLWQKKKSLVFWQEHRLLIIATVVGLPLTLLNPNGYQPYQIILSSFLVVFKPFLPTGTLAREASFVITEWEPFLNDPRAWQAWFYVGFYSLWLMTFVLSFRKTNLAYKILQITMVLPFVLFSFLVGKFLPLAVLVALPFLGRNLKAVLTKEEKKLRVTPMIGFLAVLPLILLALGYHYFLGRPLQATWYNFPYQATEFILANKLQGPMYNPYNWGGFLIWRLYPGYQVFIDGRVEMFLPDVIDDFEIIRDGLENWQDPLAKHQVNFLLLPPRDVHPALASSDEWIMVYFDNLAAVYLKDDPANQALIDQFGYRQIRPFLPQVYVEKGQEAQAVVEYQRALENEPELFKAHYDLGVIYVNLEEYAKAETHLRQAVAIFPKSINSHYNLAFCLEKQGKIKEAQKHYVEYEWLSK